MKNLAVYNGFKKSKKGCVYKIKNLITNRYYIGLAYSFDARLDGHFNQLKNNKHHSKSMQADYNKYGIGSFVCGIIDQSYNDYDRMSAIEDLLIKSKLPAYNTQLKGDEKFISNSFYYKTTW